MTLINMIIGRCPEVDIIAGDNITHYFSICPAYFTNVILKHFFAFGGRVPIAAVYIYQKLGIGIFFVIGQVSHREGVVDVILLLCLHIRQESRKLDVIVSAMLGWVQRKKIGARYPDMILVFAKKQIQRLHTVATIHIVQTRKNLVSKLVQPSQKNGGKNHKDHKHPGPAD